MKFLILLALFSFTAFAEERLKFSQVFTEIPSTAKETFSTSFSKDSLPYWGVILSSTGLLYRYDEEIYREFQKKGRDWRIGNHDNTRAAVSFGGQELVRLPSDTGSFMYFLGDGWMHAGIAGSFMAAGALKEDNYHYNTGVILIHGMITSTIFNQTLKRSFGRESPEVSTSKRGSWNLFPSFNDYNTKTASYDAMPSGHVMTATMTFTILAERYPDMTHIIYPVGGVWISALMFQMVNNGVHWASDYPLGIAMGYVIGKAATKIIKTDSDNKKTETSWNVMPAPSNGTIGILASKKFF